MRNQVLNQAGANLRICADLVEGYAEDDAFIELRSKPNFFMRLRRVLGCRSRILAAPFTPSMTHLVCARTSRMCRFSTCSRECDSPFEGWPAGDHHIVVDCRFGGQREQISA